jgi:hypothetical protein
MSVENTVTFGFGWKHAAAIVGLGILAASLYRNNFFGLGGIADKIASTASGIVPKVG